jgi:hypothetical protein
MEDSDIQKILKIILSKVGPREFEWRVEGSANLRVQGLEVTVRDLDITTSKEGITRFRQKFGEYVTKDFYNDKVQGLSLVMDIEGCEVEINSYEDEKYHMFDHIKIIQWKGLTVPTLPLPYAKKFYEMVNRPQKVQLIEEHLRRKQ